MAKLQLEGQRFGRLVVLRKAGHNRHRHVLWLARCDCGTERAFVGTYLRTGDTRSCGCLQRELTAEMGRNGEARRTHGMSDTPEHTAWVSLKRRCLDPQHPSYEGYGGRGIGVCASWLGPDGFSAFLADMGPRPSKLHSIERANNDAGYEPGNCRWALRQEQARNTRVTKLNAEAVKVIRCLAGKRPGLTALLARLHRIPTTSISAIVRERYWKSLDVIGSTVEFKEG